MKKIEVPNWQEIKIRFLEDKNLGNVIYKTPGETFVYQCGFEGGIAYANEQLEKDDAGNDWQPIPGMKVVGWGHSYDREENDRTTIGTYHLYTTGDYHKIGDLNHNAFYNRTYVAELLTLDEIGRPPAYFIERGKCTLRKGTIHETP